MAQWAELPLREPRPGAFPWRQRASRGGPGGRGSPERLRGWVAPEYRWNAGSPRALPLHGRCRETCPVGQAAEPPLRPRLASVGPAWVQGPPAAAAPARGPRRPSTAQGPAALEARRCPLPFLASRSRKAEAQAAPDKPFVQHAEAPEPRGGGALGEDAGEDAWACGAAGIVRKQRSSHNKRGRRNGANSSPGQQMSSIPQENFSLWNLDSEVPVPENKNFQPRRDGAAGGRISKNYLEFPVEQLMLELNLSEHAQKRTQNCKQGVFQLWSYPLHEGSTMENREFRASAVEAGLRGSSNPISLFPLNHSLPSASAEKHLDSVPGPPMPWDLCWPYADGDFLKDTDELHSSSRSAVECKSAGTFPAPPWTSRYGNSSVEENLTDESDLSETEKTNDTLLSYFKKMDSKLKPETIENIEESFTEEPDEAFAYPDFLPAPLHALDLHKLALSKSESWRAAADPLESSTEPLITRLLELERLQHATIQKEKLRVQPAVCAPTAPEQPSASKATPRAKQPKAADPLSSQTSWADKSREKRKNNSGSYKLEQNASKWSWSSSGKCKWDSRPTSLRSSSTVRHLTACDDPKNLRGSLFNPGQELAAKPTLAQTTHSLVTMVSTRYLPPRSPIPVSPVPLTFPENPREEIEAPRTKKNLHRKNIALNRPYYIQKLNCLSTSFIAKNKCSPIDQK